MKRILCYGDSNTHGSTGEGQRLDDRKQWSNVLWDVLGDDYWVIQEGLGGRVAGELDERAYMNGRPSFEVVYRSAWPVDAVIIALGTNDLKAKYDRTADDIANDLLWYKQEIDRLALTGKQVQVLYVCPENHPQAQPGVHAGLVRNMKRFDVSVIDLGDIPRGPDNLHFSEAGHAIVAQKIHAKLKEMNI
jgi:lysophospholipase L1-like esterase